MSPTRDRTLDDPQAIIIDLQSRLADVQRMLDHRTAERDEAQRQLAERTVDRDEVLAREAATAEVLAVINASPDDLEPVFQAILQNAHTLCGASFGALMTFDGDRFHPVAHQGTPALFREFLGSGIRPARGDPFGLMVEGAALAHIHDLSDVAARHPSEPLARAAVDLGRIRTLLVVPLCKDNALLGAITAYRQQVQPFSEKQIALLQNFAAQAVIAMENARLLNELRQRTHDLQESLEYQTASADVLKVISHSGAELGPVLDNLVDTVARICRADSGFIFRLQDGLCRAVASFGISGEHEDFEVHNPVAPGPGTLAGRTVLKRRPIHIEDAATDPEYIRADAVKLPGQRTMLGMPLIRNDALIGVITLARSHVEPFTEKQIAQVTTFADQAVIAIENARLFDEIRQRQAELRVTFDNMGDGVVMFDEALRLAAWNRNFEEMLDLPRLFLASRPSYGEYLRVLGERGEFGSRDIEGELQKRLAEVDQELRLEHIRPDGRVTEVRCNAVPGGGFVLIYSDITERKEAETRLRAARDTAEGALRELRATQANLIHAERMASLGQLTAGVAHEIKNPLNFVNNFAGLSVELLDELKKAAGSAVASLGDDRRADIAELVATLSGNLEKIAEHGRRADGIVTSMLLHSRGASGERREVDLNALVDEALNLAYHGARAREQSCDIVLEREFDRDARPIELVPQDITRVLLNLIGNGFYAASAKRRGVGNGVPASLKVTTCDLGDTVEIRVRDNGGGVPREIRDKLFQPFFTTKPTGEGTGLGLSISWDIVTHEHGGTIEVDSTVGEYTEFTVRLPRTPGFQSPPGPG
jgi:two-component system, NtrC family, sensor kinase